MHVASAVLPTMLRDKLVNRCLCSWLILLAVSVFESLASDFSNQN